MIKAGITGGSGAGKTFLLELWRRLGVFVIDADSIYHGLLDSSLTLRSELYGRFGGGVFTDGKVDRKALASIVFNDPASLMDLNEITHRHVIGETHRLLDTHKPEKVAIDAIALIESGMVQECDAVVCLVAERALRIERIMKRDGITEQRALERIDAQKPDEFYIRHSDYVIVNDGDEAALEKKCADGYERIFIRSEKREK